MQVKPLLAMSLSLLLLGCASGGFSNDGMVAQSNGEAGVNYLLGRGVPQNHQKAFYYFHKAADEEDAFAQNEVAYLYAAGKGTPRDYQQALRYYQKAADHDLASAEYNLGLMYAHGLGTSVNQSRAEEWFKKAAAHGFEPALIALKRTAS